MVENVRFRSNSNLGKQEDDVSIKMRKKKLKTTRSYRPKENETHRTVKRVYQKEKQNREFVKLWEGNYLLEKSLSSQTY